MDGRRPRRLVPALLLMIAVALAYQPAWDGGLLWDDAANLTHPELRSVDGLSRIWLDVGATQQYYPLLHTAFWVEQRLWGEEPLGYHLTNIVLHALAAVLLAHGLLALALPGAWLAAFVFALHPVHVESVAWITEQKNTLSAVFFLGAILAWLRFDDTRSRRAWALALGLCVLALLTKTSTAPLFGVLLVIAWWKRGRLDVRRDVVPVLPFLALGTAAGLFTASVELEHVGATGELFDLTLAQRLQLAGLAPWSYLGKLLWPADLAFVYPRWQLDLTGALALLPLAALLVLLAGAWRLRRRTRGPLAGLLIFLGLLVPVLGVVNQYYFAYSFVADHWQYLPSLGVIVPLAVGAARLAGRLQPAGQRAAAVGAVALLLLLAGLTARQCRLYEDVETSYRAVLAENPTCWMAHNNLGVVLAESGRAAEACGHFAEALRLRPDYGEAHHSFGAALVRLDRLEEAVAHYEESLRVRPGSVETHYSLGNALVKLGRVPDAIRQYEVALALHPDYSEARNNLGHALILLGLLPEAIAQYEEALRRRPDFAKAHVSLGDALLRSGRAEEAQAHFLEALRLRPDDEAAGRGLREARQPASPPR